jgi:hypothetical protein
VAEAVTITVAGSGTLSNTVTSSIGTSFTLSGTAIAITAAPDADDTTYVAYSTLFFCFSDPLLLPSFFSLSVAC